MKILVTLDFPPEHGGIQKYLYEIVRHTYNAGDHVLVGSRQAKNNCSSDCVCQVSYCASIVSLYNKKYSLIPVFFRLLKLCISASGKLSIDAGNLYAAIPLYVLSFIYKFEYGIYCYGGELLLLKRKGLKGWILRNVLCKAAYHYYISTYTAGLLRDLGCGKRLIYAPPKIDISNIRFLEKTSQTILHLLSVGRLVKHKGHEILLRSVRMLPSDMNWNLTIAGNGPEIYRIKKMINEFSLDRQVSVCESPSDKELSELYQRSHIFLLPSLETRDGTEGFGIVLLEAMAYRIPVIASRVGGVTDVLKNGMCGVLVQPGSPGEFASAIVSVSTDETLRANLVQEAAKYLAENFVW